MSIKRAGARKESDGQRPGERECLETRKQCIMTDLALI